MSGQEKGSTQCGQIREKAGERGERERKREVEREKKRLERKWKKERHTTFKQKQKECVT